MRITFVTAVALTCVITLVSPVSNASGAPRVRAPAPASVGQPVATPAGTTGALPGPAGAGAASAPKAVQARSAYLTDGRTGRTLWARRPHDRRAIGSITKVMTAVVVLRSGSLDRTITIRPRHLAYAARRNGSTARLRAGDRLTTRELLNALLLPSGCDAAAALADTYGPGPSRFVRKMNATARALGLTRTRYDDPAGLPPTPGHSTARDQVKLGRYAMRFSAFRQVVRRKQHMLPADHRHQRYVWHSTNQLLGTYPGMIGIKSGYTSAAGYSLLFAARRKGRTLFGIVLDSSRTQRQARFSDAARVLDWGFR
ncbi:serine hydrolase [Actinomadura vinacea]|uniref:Serine hydrolase n=1 Tax=Actinomadura vinacea TaxID=115336 RepID=A0ABP5X472_9ACTN